MIMTNCHRVFPIRKICNHFKLSSTNVLPSAIIKRHFFNWVKPLQFTNFIIEKTELLSVLLPINSVSYHSQRKHQGNLHLLQIRKNHNTMEANLDDPREFRIKVPFGHIAGKVWNDSAPVAVLCLHGWQDNAGTFDTLAPLLPKHLCLVAIDFPGQGFSSHKPLGFSTLIADYVLCVDRVVKHFGWEKVVILGHSMGAGTGVLFAGIRPDVVHSLVMIDLIKLHHTPAEKQPRRTKQAMDDILAAEHKILNVERPSYPYEELLQRAMKSHESSLNEAGVKTLLKRGSELLPSGRYTFTYDLQIRTHSIISMTLEQQMAFAESLRCRLLILKAEDGPYYEAKEHYDAILDKYRSASSEFQYLTVPGRHHTHLDTPQHVAPLIADFLSLEKLGGLKNNLFSAKEEQQESGNTKTRVMVANEKFKSVL